MRAPHGADFKKLGCYLAATKNDEIILDPDKNKILKVFADTNF